MAMPQADVSSARDSVRYSRDLERPAQQSDPSALFALGDSGGSDVGAHKDAYVGEAISAIERKL